MNTPLQGKDDRSRDRRANGATPVFDPAMAIPGTDVEAGGASDAAPHGRTTGPARTPLPAAPHRNGPGLQLTPPVWFMSAGTLVALLAIAAWLSLT